MKVLVACEFSGTVRDAFISLGHDAISCDLLPSNKPGPHIQDNVLNHLDEQWDLIIAHPPCTHLACSGARWFKYKKSLQTESLNFFKIIFNSHCNRIAIENPVGIVSTQIKKPSQVIHPWQFGHGEQKATCLWLKNLPKLIPTNIVPGRVQRLYNLSPSTDRWKIRSMTFPGIANAMAEQWSLDFPIQLSLF